MANSEGDAETKGSPPDTGSDEQTTPRPTTPPPPGFDYSWMPPYGWVLVATSEDAVLPTTAQPADIPSEPQSDSSASAQKKYPKAPPPLPTAESPVPPPIPKTPPPLPTGSPGAPADPFASATEWFLQKYELSKTYAKKNPVVAGALGVVALLVLTSPFWFLMLGLGVQQVISSPEERFYQDAQKESQAGKDWDSIRLATLAVRRNPTHVGASYLIGLGEHELGEYNAAIVQLNKTIGLDANNVKAHLLLARSYLESRQPISAVQEADIVTQLARDQKSLQEAAHIRGMANYALRQFAKAGKDLKIAAEGNQQSAELYADYAKCLLEEALYEDCIEQCNKALKINAAYPQAYDTRGMAFQKLNNIQQALSNFKNASHLCRANTSYALHWAALSADHTKNYIEILDQVFPILRFNPTTTDETRLRHLVRQIAERAYKASFKQFRQKKDCASLADICVIYKSINRPQWAVQVASQAVRMHPDCADAYFRRAQARLVRNQRGDVESAVSDADKALSLNANLINAYITRGFALELLQRYDEAVKDYQRYLDHDGMRVPAAQDRMAQCYAELGSYTLALKNATDAVNNEPSCSEYTANRAALNSDQQNYDAALKDLKEALKTAETFDDLDRIYTTRLGIWMYGKVDMQRAKDDALRVLVMHPNRVDTLVAMAKACNGLNQPAEAQGYSSRALRLAPKNLMANREQATSYLLQNDNRAALASIALSTISTNVAAYFTDLKALAQFRAGEYAQAEATTLGIKPVHQAQTFDSVRGLSMFYQDRGKEALNFLRQLSEKSPTAEGYLVPLFVVEAKESGLNEARAQLRARLGKLSESARRSNLIAKFLAGELSKQDLLRDVGPGLPAQTNARVAAGLVDLYSGNKAAAKEEFLWVRQNGYRGGIEPAVALAELRR